MHAIYFDGRSAQIQPVTLSMEGDMVVVSGERVQRRDPIGAVQITEAVGRTPRVLRFVGGASCEVADLDGFADLLRQHGVAEAPVAALDRSWRFVAAAVVLIALSAVLGYRYGLPAVARSTADRLPPSALNLLSKQIQTVLDTSVFSPTTIDGRRQAALLNGLDALKWPGPTRPVLKIEFRHSERLGANAMALPSGTIFVTDELVDLTADDRMILAVIAHEAGHVQKRHGLRQIIQSTIMGGLVTWYIGDVSALSAAAPTALLQAKYSRDLEREADAYAAETLAQNGMPASLLADALEALEKSRGGTGASGALAYLSSHPASDERIAWLRAYHR